MCTSSDFRGDPKSVGSGATCPAQHSHADLDALTHSVPSAMSLPTKVSSGVTQAPGPGGCSFSTAKTAAEHPAGLGVCNLHAYLPAALQEAGTPQGHPSLASNTLILRNKTKI